MMLTINRNNYLADKPTMVVEAARLIRFAKDYEQLSADYEEACADIAEVETEISALTDRIDDIEKRFASMSEVLQKYRQLIKDKLHEYYD